MAEDDMRTDEALAGQALLSWEIDEYPRYQRGRLWYVLALLVGLMLLIYAVGAGNFLFALIILMSALVIYLSSLGEPGKKTVILTEVGVGIGDEFFPFRDISRYWFIYEPPEVKNLYLDFKSPFRPKISISLEGENPNIVRTVLGQYLREDLEEDEEPFSDFIGRIFKI